MISLWRLKDNNIQIWDKNQKPSYLVNDFFLDFSHRAKSYFSLLSQLFGNFFFFPRISLVCFICHILCVFSLSCNTRESVESEIYCLGSVGLAQLEAGNADGAGEAQIVKVLQEIERHKSREISLCQKLPVILSSHPTLPSVSQCLFPLWPINAN